MFQRSAYHIQKAMSRGWAKLDTKAGLMRASNGYIIHLRGEPDPYRRSQSNGEEIIATRPQVMSVGTVNEP